MRASAPRRAGRLQLAQGFTIMPIAAALTALPVGLPVGPEGSGA